MTKIFASTSDAQAQYDSAVQERISNEQPDAVYGLRRTERFEELLQGPQDPNARITIYDNNEIIFPFLILEAKAETSTDNLHTIENQVGLAISEMLNIQSRLFESTGRLDYEDTGPIVWFIATKGDLWKIHVAYIDMVRGKQCYVRCVISEVYSAEPNPS